MIKNINLNKTVIFVISLLFIIISHYYIYPVEVKWRSLVNQDYEFKSYNINKKNKWSTFKREENGNFFIHPGQNKYIAGILKFKKSLVLNLDFTIRKGGELGKIAFIVIKNLDLLDLSNNTKTYRFYITYKKPYSLGIKVKKDDTIVIIADKYGDTGQDWGNLKIQVKDFSDLYQSYYIIGLWILLFMVLFFNNDILLFFNSYVLYSIFIYAEKLNYGNLSINSILTYLLFSFLITFAFALIYRIVKKSKLLLTLFFIIYSTIFLIPIGVIVYNLNFNKNITNDIIIAVLQTNPRQAVEFIHSYIKIDYLVAFFIFIVFWVLFFILQVKNNFINLKKYPQILLIVFLVFAIFLEYENMRLPYFIFQSVKEYYKELNIFREIQAKRKAGKFEFNAVKKHKGETYVIVLGESLNKYHTNLYGYFRKTTPKLMELHNKEKFLLFKNAYSHHTHTLPVLTLALTEANQYNKKGYYTSVSILDILNKSQCDTYWLTNQVLYGPWDSAVTVLIKTAKNIIAINRSIGKSTITQKYDGELIKEFKKVLAKKTDKTKVIFVHLMGSHAEYSQRYPHDKFDIFKGNLNPGIFGKEASKNVHINPYDNSVVYTDYVVSEILKEVINDNGTRAFLFLSDHADDIVRDYGHNSGQFTFEMTQIPMFFWFSNDFKDKYPEIYNNLKIHSNMIFSNDLLYDSLIGFFNIKTDRYQPKFDLTSSQYALNVNDALIFRKIYYTDDKNYIYWQKKNSSYIIKTGLDSKIFPLRVNSIGKLFDIWRDGFRAFEIDVRFNDNNSDRFKIGNDLEHMGLYLDEFLNKIKYKNIKKVYFDFQNLSEFNANDALVKLDLLDKKYNLKNKVILESSVTRKYFKNFRKNGWNTSYKLPAKEILKLISEGENEKLEKLTEKIAAQIKEQDVSAISFDIKLYSFVKKYLESKINKTIKYHIKNAFDLSNLGFEKNVQNNPLLKDVRVEFLLCKFKSLYNL